jgi:hypothetical protein
LLVEKASAVADASLPEARLLLLAQLRQAVDTAMVAALVEIEDSPRSVLLDGAVDGGQWLASRSELHPAEAGALAGLATKTWRLPIRPAARGESGRMQLRRTKVGRRFAPLRRLSSEGDSNRVDLASIAARTEASTDRPSR